MAKKKKHKKPRKRSGLTVGIKSGKRKRPGRKSGLTKGMEGWRGALLASGIMRLTQGAVGYFARTQNKGEDLPKIKMIVPGAIALAASNGLIPVSGMFPAAVQALVDAAVDNTDFLKNIFDFKFMDKPRSAPAAVHGLRVNQLAAPMRSRSGLLASPEQMYSQRTPLDGLMAQRGGGMYNR